MRAIELSSKTDVSGFLKIEYKLNKSNSNVRVIILFDEEPNDPDEEKLWLMSISKNPAFDYLKEPEENIYSLQDGDSLND
jgi:hypothetical protein